MQLARLTRARRVHSIGAFFDVLDNSVPVDHEGDAIGKEVREIQNSVGLGNTLFRITQQRKACAGLSGKFAVSFLAVEADAQHLHPPSFEPGDITLIRLDLLRSTGRGGANIKCQNDGFPAPKIGKLYEFAVLIRQRKIRGSVADFGFPGCAQ